MRYLRQNTILEKLLAKIERTYTYHINVTCNHVHKGSWKVQIDNGYWLEYDKTKSDCVMAKIWGNQPQAMRLLKIYVIIDLLPDYVAGDPIKAQLEQIKQTMWNKLQAEGI